MIGHTISHYKVIEKLGQGGMGVVYKAKDTRLDRHVAIKILPAESVSDPERRRRFVQEAKAASALNHPNIVTIHDLDSAGDVHFIVMEFVAGRTLDRLIGSKGMKLSEALDYAAQISDALSKAHAAGIIHRDLKPTNIMVTAEGKAKVLDFGLAKLLEPRESHSSATTATLEQPQTEEGAIVGTVAYMSPEQAEGKKIDPRSDIFSFGSVLYEMLTGRRAFRGETKGATLAAIIREEPPPPGEMITGLPQEVERAVMRCLRKDPQRRWQNMADLTAILQDLKEEADSGKLSSGGRLPTPRRRRITWMIPALVLLIAVMAVISQRLFRKPGMQTPPPISRLTYDPGLTLDPAISPDGKLAAYASDRSGEGNLDIWVRQLAGREPSRRTRNAADDWQPSFSADGSIIAFRSERNGGGIYTIDAVGGEQERKIADHGQNPRFSPEGSLISYWEQTGVSGIGTNRMYLIPAQGGIPRPFQPEFGVEAPPIWSPDGKHLLFSGMRSNDPKSYDWWVAPVDGGPATRTGTQSLQFPQYGAFFYPHAWLRDQVIFTRGSAVEGINIYRTPISPGTWKLSDQYQQLTSGPGMRFTAAVAPDGRILFPSMNIGMNLSVLALDANTGAPSGEPRVITQDSTTKGFPAISWDGSKLAYIAYTGSRAEVRVMELADGRVTTIAAANPTSPKLSADGSRLAYSDRIQGKQISFLVTDVSAAGKPVCENCLILDFFSDPTKALIRYGRNLLVRQDLDSGDRINILETKVGWIEDASLSHDARWIAFMLAKPTGHAALCVSPLRGTAVPEQEWITVAEEARYLASPRWSPDGNLIYFLSERDGPCCVWAQRLDARTKKPVGAPFGVWHEHRPRYAVLSFTPRSPRTLPVAKDKLVVFHGDTTSNIWQMQLEIR